MPVIGIMDMQKLSAAEHQYPALVESLISQIVKKRQLKIVVVRTGIGGLLLLLRQSTLILKSYLVCRLAARLVVTLLSNQAPHNLLCLRDWPLGRGKPHWTPRGSCAD